MVRNSVGKFSDNCVSGINSRLINSIVNSEDNNTKNINVILKTAIYPNPSNGEFTLKLLNGTEKGNIDLQVYDISGKLVFKNAAVANQELIAIKTNLTKGIYLLKVTTKDGSVDIHRIVIE